MQLFIAITGKELLSGRLLACRCQECRIKVKISLIPCCTLMHLSIFTIHPEVLFTVVIIDRKDPTETILDYQMDFTALRACCAVPRMANVQPIWPKMLIVSPLINLFLKI